MELVNARCKPTFQHEFALSRLKQSGYQLAVASNSVRNTVLTMMEKSALTPYLEVLLSNEDVEHGKPAPDIYIAAAEKLGVPPQQCLVVEDNPKGIESAERAGCPVMVVEAVYDVTLENIQKRITEIESVTA
jgi:HAD superfamily hydrolase (TIGR01509 family)